MDVEQLLKREFPRFETGRAGTNYGTPVFFEGVCGELAADEQPHAKRGG
jgi:hypothetical protein